MVSLGLISHSKEKATTYAQARVDGAKVEVKPTKSVIAKKVWRPK